MTADEIVAHGSCQPTSDSELVPDTGLDVSALPIHETSDSGHSSGGSVLNTSGGKLLFVIHVLLLYIFVFSFLMFIFVL